MRKLSHKVRISALLCLAALALLAGCSRDSDTANLDCPVPQPLGSDMAIKETQEDIWQIGKRLADDQSQHVVAGIIFDLKRQHPSASVADIINYLVTAYCPVVAAQGSLSKHTATGKIDQFSTQVNKILNAPD